MRRWFDELDGWGAMLATVGLCGITFGLIEAGTQAERGRRSPEWLEWLRWPVFLCGGVEIDAPMLPLDLFRSRTFSGANLMTLFLYGALSAVLFFLPLDLIQVQHYSATEAGAALLPLILLVFLLSRWSGGLVGEVWSEAAADCWAADCGGGVRVVDAGWRGGGRIGRRCFRL